VLLNFFRKESCGKCSPCRICTQKAYEILTDISKGRGSMGDLDALREISIQLNELSNCGLGQTAAVPLRDTLTHFRDEVEAHIRLKVCPAGVCSMS
jgi:NADP-reducing hydrogenase subunit HndC